MSQGRIRKFFVERAEKVFETVKEKLHRGAANKKDAPADVKHDVKFIEALHRLIRTEFHDLFMKTALNLSKEDPKFKDYEWLVLQIFRATLALLYKCGNCGEQAAVALTHYIETGLWTGERLEYVFFEGNKKKDSLYNSHGFLTVNRDTKIPVTTPWSSKQKEDIIKIDTWLDEQIQVYNAAHPAPPLKDFAPGLASITVTDTYKIDRDLRKKELEEIIVCLRHIKTHLNSRDAAGVFNRYKKSSKDLKLIKDAIDYKIEIYQKMIEQHSTPIEASYYDKKTLQDVKIIDEHFPSPPKKT